MSFNIPDNNLYVELTDGRKFEVALCTCGACKNDFFCIDRPEHQPSFCPYCGMRFKWYDDGSEAFHVNGTRI